jgi:hypothetical protein
MKHRRYITGLFVTKYKSGKTELDYQGSRDILVDPASIPEKR